MFTKAETARVKGSVYFYSCFITCFIMWILLKRQKWSFFSCRKIGSNQLPSWRVYAFGCSCFYPRTVYLCNTKNAGVQILKVLYNF